jgi:hypothetical protein
MFDHNHPPLRIANMCVDIYFTLQWRNLKELIGSGGPTGQQRKKMIRTLGTGLARWQSAVF